MRRVLLMFLLVLLPFQYVWAAAAPYCQHEQAAAQHVGHHEHKHQRSAKSSAGEPAKASGQLSASLDDDCGYCQQSASKPIFSGVSGLVIAGGLPLQPLASPALPSRDPDRVERPNWRRLV